MNLDKLMELSEEQRNNFHEYFLYEKVLMDTEEDLNRDYQYYSKRLKSLGKAHTSLDVGIQSVYNAHLKNISRLLGLIEYMQTEELSEPGSIKRKEFFSGINLDN